MDTSIAHKHLKSCDGMINNMSKKSYKPKYLTGGNEPIPSFASALEEALELPSGSVIIPRVSPVTSLEAREEQDHRRLVNFQRSLLESPEWRMLVFLREQREQRTFAYLGQLGTRLAIPLITLATVVERLAEQPDIYLPFTPARLTDETTLRGCVGGVVYRICREQQLPFTPSVIAKSLGIKTRAVREYLQERHRIEKRYSQWME